MKRSLLRYIHPSLRCIALAAPLLLAGCDSDVRQSLGLGKEAPDEFVVLSRPPLTVPPDFELRPPATEGTTSPHATTTDDAQKALFGNSGVAPVNDAGLTDLRAPKVDTAVTPVISSPAPSSATASFLSKAGADQASPDIRTQLKSASAPANDEAPTLYDRVTGKKLGDSVVDPNKEAARIRDNKQEGKPITAGDTPTATPKEPSVLDRIF